MKILHTADWHLGKKLFKVSRLHEQKLFLEWLLSTIKSEGIDALIIAGDIFDSINPPCEATKLFFDFLWQLASTTNTSTYIISGNHDSGAFLDAPKEILKHNRIHISGKLHGNTLDFIDQGNVRFTLLPFFRSYEILCHKAEVSSDLDDDSFILKYLDDQFLKVTSDKTLIHILIAHHLFVPSSSITMNSTEQSVTLSGLDHIPTAMLENKFNYVALGHIHKEMVVKDGETISKYSGSPIVYRFSESKNKAVTVLNTHDDLTYDIDRIAIPEFRKIETLKVKIDDLEEAIVKVTPGETKETSTLLEVKLQITEPVVGVADRIRELLKDKYVDLLALQFITSDQDVEDEPHLIVNGELPSIEELFKSYYKTQFQEADTVPEDLLHTFLELLEEE